MNCDYLVGPTHYQLIIFLKNIFSDKTKQRPPRREYGRLSVDSDDCNKKDCLSSPAIIDNRPCLTINTKRNKSDLEGNNNINDSDSDSELNLKIKNESRNHRIDENTISRLQAMAMSDDDDDYGEFNLSFINVI